MKTFKFKLLIPVIAIVFALTSAFTTSASSNVAAFTSVDGFIDTPAPCQERIDCSPTGSIVCTNILQQQAYGKNASGTLCNVEVYQPAQ